MKAASHRPLLGPGRVVQALLGAALIGTLVLGGPSTFGGKGESLLKRMFSGPPTLEPLSVSLVLSADIALPGPLPEATPKLVDGQVIIPVAGGIARSSWAPGSEAIISDDTSTVATENARTMVDDKGNTWAVDPNQRYRARFRDDGKLVVQRRCRFLCSGWNKIWKLRVPGTENGLPLLTDTRIYFGAPDNLVYSVRKRTGERLWAADIKERASRPVMIWQAPASATPDNATLAPETDDDPATAARRSDPPTSKQPSRQASKRSSKAGGNAASGIQELVVVLPDAGTRLLALDARTGSIAARYELRGEGDGTLRGTPLVTPDGKILVTRDKYRPDEASLMVFEVATTSSTSAGTARQSAEDSDDESSDDRVSPNLTGGSREKKNGS